VDDRVGFLETEFGDVRLAQVAILPAEGVPSLLKLTELVRRTAVADALRDVPQLQRLSISCALATSRPARAGWRGDKLAPLARARRARARVGL
jgi:hypothetical protein